MRAALRTLLWTPSTRPTVLYDGTDDYAQAGNVLDSTFAGVGKKFTVTAWIRSDRASGWNDIIVGKYDGNLPAAEFFFRVSTGGKIEFVWYGALSGASAEGVLGSSAIGGDGKLHHVAASYDQTQALDSNVALYVDGVLESMTPTDTGVPVSIQTSITPLAIGAAVWQDNSSHSWFKGLVDEVHIYSAVLTAAQVKADMVAQLQGNEANLVSAWRCNEGGGLTLANRVATAVAMTAIGITWQRRQK